MSVAADTATPAPTGVVCAPLLVEWLAVRDRLHGDLVRIGQRARRPVPAGRPMLVAGVAGALTDDLRPGDLVVAEGIRAAAGLGAAPGGSPSPDGWPSHAAPFLAGGLRRLGLRVHRGAVVTAPSVVDGAAGRSALGGTGALAVDLESCLVAAAGRPGTTAVVRAVVDTPARPLLRPGTLRRGPLALSALRRAAPVLDAWAAAVGDRDVLLAGPRSFCAGVERAIEVVERALARNGAPVYVRRQIVHNAHVVADLERRGAVFVQEVEEVPPGSVVVLAAHGVAPEVRVAAEQRGLRVVDATCPLVTKVHTEVRRFADRDHTVLLIGHPDHEEVEGTVGEAPADVVVVADPGEAARVQVRDPRKVAYVMQTTLAAEEAERTAEVLRERFPGVRAPRRNDICYATTNRQLAVRDIARDCDLVLVVGSRNSSNSRRLVEVARAQGTAAHLVEDAEAVELGWLVGARTVGITAGASAPSRLVDDLVRALGGLGQVTVHERETTSENVRFTLPREVI